MNKINHYWLYLKKNRSRSNNLSDVKDYKIFLKYKKEFSDLIDLQI